MKVKRFEKLLFFIFTFLHEARGLLAMFFCSPRRGKTVVLCNNFFIFCLIMYPIRCRNSSKINKLFFLRRGAVRYSWYVWWYDDRLLVCNARWWGIFCIFLCLLIQGLSRLEIATGEGTKWRKNRCGKNYSPRKTKTKRLRLLLPLLLTAYCCTAYYVRRVNKMT